MRTHARTRTRAAIAVAGERCQRCKGVGGDPQNPTFTAVFQAKTADTFPYIRLRMVLKRLLRSAGFKCIDIMADPAPTGTDMTAIDIVGAPAQEGSK